MSEIDDIIVDTSKSTDVESKNGSIKEEEGTDKLKVTPPKDDEESIEEEKLNEEPEESEETEETEETPEYITNRPTWAVINKKFPEFFKEFPQMKHVIGREMAYSNIFPSIDEAKDAQTDSNNFDILNNYFESGDTKEICSLMKDTDEKAYEKFVDNFLPTLQTQDSNTFYKITAPLIQNVINQVYSANKGRDENIQNAALVIADYLFGNEDFAKNSPKITNVEDSRNNNTERDKFFSERESLFQTEISSSVTQEVKDAIFDDIINQFPDQKIPDNMKDLIADQVDSSFYKIDKSLGSDESHINMMKSLWKRAKNSGYTGDWKDRIIQAYLSRAKELIPSQRKRLQPLIPNKHSSNGKNGSKRIPAGNTSSNGDRNYSSRDIDWNKTSDRDFLDDKITLKG